MKLTYNDSDLILAPIAGFSNIALRSLSFQYGVGLAYTEMVSAKGLYYKSENTSDLLKIGQDEKYTGVQLFGSDPGIISEVITYDVLKDFPVIDINAGCPVPKIVKNGDGSALMRNPSLIYDIIKSAVSTSNNRPVTIKLRKGISGLNNVVECALAAEEAGASLVTVHGRTREQMYTGTADLDIIAEVKSKLKIPVCGNGDVVDRATYLKMKETGVDYVMIARGALGKPYIFSEVQGIDFTYDIKDLMLKHIDYMTYLPEKVLMSILRGQLIQYLKGVHSAKRMKKAIFKCTTIQELKETIQTF